MVNLPEDVKTDIEIAKKILIDAGCTEIYVFGSLINGKFDENSDIDLAVVGLEKKIFFKIYGELLANLSREVDLIGLDYDNDFSRLIKDSNNLERVA